MKVSRIIIFVVTLMLAVSVLVLFTQYAYKSDKASSNQEATAQILTIPARIEAENFTQQSGWNTNSDNFIIEVNGDADGGKGVGWVQPGKWLKYKISVPHAGKYFVRYRVANAADKALSKAFELHDQNGAVIFFGNVPPTETWYNWETVHGGTVEFANKGEQLLTVYFKGSMNLNWFEISKQAAAPELTDKSPVPGIYDTKQTIELKAPTAGTKIFYTTDGSQPTSKSTAYTAPIAVASNITIKAIAVPDGANNPDQFQNSGISSFDYKFGYVPKLGKDSIQDIVNSMSVYEKAVLLGGDPAGNRIPNAAGGTHHGLYKKYNIPGTSLADGPAGVRIKPSDPGFVDKNGHKYQRFATQFPNASMRAATWNFDLVKAGGEGMAKEALFFGVDVLLSPGLTIHRHPLNGRNFEYFSEDPFLTGKMAIAEVQGIQSQNVGATLKPLTANNQESGRFNLPTNLSQRALREIYLRSFEMAVKESQPWAIMTSYNQINGISTTQNPELLQNIIRDEWEFNGIIMSDWGVPGNSSFWGEITNPFASMVKASLDLHMPYGNTESIIASYEKGFLKMEEIDACVKRFLEYIVKTPRFKGVQSGEENNIYAVQNEKLSFELAVEGMVILKNESVSGKKSLPVKKGNIALIGNAANKMVRGGMGSGNVNINADRLVHLTHALSDTYKGGMVKDASTLGFAMAGNEINPTKEQMNELVESVEHVIYTIARSSTENADISALKGGYRLTDAESKLIELASEACRAASKPFIVVLNIGSPIEMESWKEKVDAILLSWQTGTVLAKPIAAVLAGAANPSGKLPSTFPVDVTGNHPVNNMPYTPATTFGNKNSVTYTEGIYVGYRYYDSFDVPVSYEFGFGKNYSSFEYSILHLSSTEFQDRVDIAVDVKNTSEVAGKEVAQLYVGAPGKSIHKPVKELKGFVKTSVLSGGESALTTFSLNAKDLASFDESRSAWVVEPGLYTVYIGASSKDIRQTAQFTVANEIIVEKVHNVLAPKVKINEIVRK